MEGTVIKNLVTMGLLVAVLSFSASGSIVLIPHDSVEPITDLDVDEIHSKFMPWINIEHGADYQAAINSNGEVSAGLKLGGASNGQCSNMQGQVYARSISFTDGTTAIMYAYYFAKDHALAGGLLGHRHDWENVIVWIDEEETVIGAAYSSHGDYSTTLSPFMIGTHVVAKYAVSGFTHSFFESTSTSGITQENLVSYNNLSALVRGNLENNDFGSAVFPMDNSHFSNYVIESRPFAARMAVLSDPVGETPEDGSFKTATNRTEATSDAKFIKLEIEL